LPLILSVFPKTSNNSFATTGTEMNMSQDKRAMYRPMGPFPYPMSNRSNMYTQTGYGNRPSNNSYTQTPMNYPPPNMSSQNFLGLDLMVPQNEKTTNPPNYLNPANERFKLKRTRSISEVVYLPIPKLKRGSQQPDLNMVNMHSWNRI
jgi:hypothetical protein